MHRQKAQERRITVLNTPGRNARSVAEFTVGLLFAEMRNIARSHAAMQAGTGARFSK
ncbi:D-3-phosphoglycerate dehydrogenase [Bacillus sp. JCM 19046]|nr:D-3-phosphoglycerate dehydrogenase [Bacillus sp. JCM 19046]